MKELMNMPILLLLSLSLSASTLFASSKKDLVATEVFLQDSSIKPRLQGGNSTSVGGDAVDERLMSAWFYGQESISTCFNRLENFGASDAEISQAVESSIQKWQNYFKAKKINSGKDSDLSINTNFKFKGKCKGDEDLVLHFGTGPIFGNIQDLKASSALKQPVAYVNKTHMSRDQKWSKGYIRFTSSDYHSSKFPDWQSPGALETIVLHELGHILGFIHEPGTIMDGSLIAQVFHLFETPTSKTLSSDIDQELELIQCTGCIQTFRMQASLDNQSVIKTVDLPWKLSTDPLQIVIADSSVTLQSGSQKAAFTDVEKLTIHQNVVLKSNFPQQLKSEKLAHLIKARLLGKNVFMLVNASGLSTGTHLELHILEPVGKTHILRFERDKGMTAATAPPPTSPRVVAANVHPRITLLNDEKAIACNGLEKDSPVKVWIDRKDREMRLTRAGKSEMFRSVRFMDHAVLFSSEKSDEFALFQIFENSQPILLTGQVQTFMENQCEDKGNSKACSMANGSALTWTPESLRYQNTKTGSDALAPVQRYGVFPNDATYFSAENSKKAALTLLDFGSELKLIEGTLRHLKCANE